MILSEDAILGAVKRRLVVTDWWALGGRLNLKRRLTFEINIVGYWFRLNKRVFSNLVFNTEVRDERTVA